VVLNRCIAIVFVFVFVISYKACSITPSNGTRNKVIKKLGDLTAHRPHPSEIPTYFTYLLHVCISEEPVDLSKG
jgi:hypothetical protein